MHIFIMANSPGELVGWVKPAVEKLKEKQKKVIIIVVIPPCQYASGMEREVVENFPEVDLVVGPSQYLKYLFLGIRPSSFRGVKRGVVVFLGGDPFHAVVLSKRLGLPAVAYMQKPRWKRYFKKFMVLDQAAREKFMAKRAEENKVFVVGDLTVDGIKLGMSREEGYSRWGLNSGNFIISILPGSRPEMVRYMTPFFLRAAELIKKELPKTQFLLALSPFVPKEELVSLDESEVSKVFQGAKIKLKKENEKWKLITESDLEVLVVEGRQYEALNISHLIITIPGTHTLEAAYLGIPMLVTIPLNKPEAIPLDGLAGLVRGVPLFGSSIKRWIVKWCAKRIKFTAIPNIRAGREIIPEIRGVIEAEDVAKEAIKLLRDPNGLARMREELREIAGGKGAADKVANIILEVGNARRGDKL